MYSFGNVIWEVINGKSWYCTLKEKLPAQRPAQVEPASGATKAGREEQTPGEGAQRQKAVARAQSSVGFVWKRDKALVGRGGRVRSVEYVASARE